MSVTFRHPALADDLNVANANARSILAFLGLPADVAGVLDARELLTRCALARHHRPRPNR